MAFPFFRKTRHNYRIQDYFRHPFIISDSECVASMRCNRTKPEASDNGSVGMPPCCARNLKGGEDTPSLVVRPVRASELLAVQRAFPARGPETHSVRLLRQEAGEASYLIAWKKGRPCGHLFLLWAGPDHDEMLARLARMAFVEDLFVPGELRGRGVGTRLLAAAEALAGLRGMPLLGLGVSVDNLAAIRLYRRLGFADSDAGYIVSRWMESDRFGVPHNVSQTLVFLVKTPNRDADARWRLHGP
jgi:GNAT superfamily N-acetyltransferase